MSVKAMLSGMRVVNCTRVVVFCYVCSLLSITFRHKRIDKTLVYGVIIFTAAAQPNRENENAAGEKQPRQAEGVTATRNTQSPPASVSLGTRDA